MRAPLVTLAATQVLLASSAVNLEVELQDATGVVAVPATPTLDAPEKHHVDAPGPHPEFVMPKAPVDYSVDVLKGFTVRTTLGKMTPVIWHDHPQQLQLF